MYIPGSSGYQDRKHFWIGFAKVAMPAVAIAVAGLILATLFR